MSAYIQNVNTANNYFDSYSEQDFNFTVANLKKKKTSLYLLNTLFDTAAVFNIVRSHGSDFWRTA